MCWTNGNWYKSFLRTEMVEMVSLPVGQAQSRYWSSGLGTFSGLPPDEKSFVIKHLKRVEYLWLLLWPSSCTIPAFEIIPIFCTHVPQYLDNLKTKDLVFGEQILHFVEQQILLKVKLSLNNNMMLFSFFIIITKWCYYPLVSSPSSMCHHFWSC